MSGTTLQTSQQPSHALSNIIDHPGSTYAGVGVIALAIGQIVQANGMPTTAAGWVTLGAELVMAVMAALGK
jgi:hypothetical protein